ncbi:pilin [Butyrivibrio sp. X503]|uniref:pilus assembly FimT family protein n=1 Tax=Butyrivibrio sp. X503 TaxID=2364878 RepID=UPI000EA83D8C|nr:prepilin-type N-terminal cleavage/methylation domain-containing protein [Butyrivibrio sp. X503]RKM56329.1 pilin [Butyrivibrio sp. X503]
MKKDMVHGDKNKGFTLAELLIVVAIIAVLVAVAIPVFTAQLDKAKVATTVANIRAGFAEAQSRAMFGDYDEEYNNNEFAIYIDDVAIPLTEAQLLKYRNDIEGQLAAAGLDEVAWATLPTDTNLRTITYFGENSKVTCCEIDPNNYRN